MDQQAFLAVTAIAKRDKGANRGAKYLRSNAYPKDQVEALHQVPVDDSTVEELLTGRLFARSWRDVFFSIKAPQIANSERSVDWLMSVFERHSAAIKVHNDLRHEFECAALHGNWKLAGDVLMRHQQSFGPSLWLLAWRYLIAEETNGVTARREITTQLMNVNCGAHLFLVANFFSISADRTLPESQVRESLANALGSANPSLRRLFELIILEDCSSHWMLSENLRTIELLTLVDRYELFLRLIVIAGASFHPEAHRLTQGLNRIKPSSTDARVHYLADTLGDSSLEYLDGNTTKLLTAWDAHLTADYQHGYELARAVALEAPHLIVANETMVRCAMQLSLEESLAGTTPMCIMWQHLRNVLSKNQDAEDSVNYLRRFGRRFRIFSLTGPLRGLHARHLPSDIGDELLRRASFMMTIHSPRNFERGHSEQVSTGYLARCIDSFPDSLAMRFLRDVQLGDATIPLAAYPSIPPIRQHLFAGLLAARRHDDDVASRNLTAFLRLQESDMSPPLALFTTEEARKALADVYRRQNDVISMQRVVIQAYRQRPASIRYFPLRRIFRFCEEHVEVASAHIEYAILAALSCEGPHDISMALRSYLATVNVNCPSELIHKDEIDKGLLAILFLRVCAWDVLDSFSTLDTPAKVEAERLLLLRWVSGNDSALNRLAETEMLRLIQEGQLRNALERIEGARVTLDVPGLTEAEYVRFADAYFRFATEREIGATGRRPALSTVTAIRAVTLIPGMSEEQANQLFQTGGSDLATFRSVFNEIRDVFLGSPHFGLEACLSGRVRHGIVIQHLRRPFVEQRLLVRKDAPELHNIEAYWGLRLDLGGAASAFKKVMGILFHLTRDVEAIAEEVKNKWLQVATESRKTGGLFDYRFSDDQLQDVLVNRLKAVLDVETFLDTIFEELLRRTRQSLRMVQERVRTELLKRLNDALHDAVKEVESLEERLVPILRNDLVTCRAEVERACQRMVRWFDFRDPTLMGDMDFSLVAQTAVGMAERLNPDYRGLFGIECDTQYLLKGRYFTALVHALFFLLENAIRHTDMPVEGYKSSVRIVTEGNRLCLTVSTQMSSTEAANQAVSKIRGTLEQLELHFDPGKVVREGGSGLAKIIATVRYAFKQDRAIIEATSAMDYVSVSVKCEVAGLVAA